MKSSKSLYQLKTSKGKTIASQCVKADDFVSRLKGLIGVKSLSETEAVFFPECKSIHMWFMSIPLDVVFVKGSNPFEIVSVHENIPAWKAFPVNSFKAEHAFEFKSGFIAKNALKKGDRLELVS